jgi:dephospho-CoA kinase
MIIGITGSFGSGKTAVSLLFKRFKIINVDKLYSEIFKENKKLKKTLKNKFGTIDRNKIKKIVFNNHKKLIELNKITHPLIIEEIKKIINNEKKKNNEKVSLKNKKNNIIIDAPLLLGSKAKKLVDKVIVVKCKKAVQIKRILKKKKYSKNEIIQIIKSQMPLKKKLKYADFVVDNSKSMKNTKKQVLKIMRCLI